jgi:diguanylate cyclase (GGDEF)-like protein
MRLHKPILGSRVGRRVFASFLAASVLPIALLAVLTLTQVSRALGERAHQQLEDASRGIGQQLLDRLLIADQALKFLPEGGLIGDAPVIEAAELVSRDGLRTLYGQPFQFPQTDIPVGAKSSLVVHARDNGYELFLARVTPRGTLVGKIDTAYLWDASALLPFAMNLCVLDSRIRSFLFCAEPMPEAGTAAALSGMARASSGRLEWADGKRDIIAVHWELFLPSRFEAAPWSVVVSQPVDVALASLHAFNKVFPPVIATSLILIMLLSLSQIRRILNPLEQLVARTKSIAERQFSTRVELDSHDEFAELGAAMNDMAERLGLQFDTITALADIDRLILSSQSIEKVLERILDRISAIAPRWCISVLLLDPDLNEQGHLYSRTPGSSGETKLGRVTVSAQARIWFARVAAGGIANPRWMREHISGLPAVPDCDSTMVVPIFRGDELRGTFIAQVADRNANADSESNRLAEFASRLAVAIAAADHEKELFDRAHFDALTGLPNRQLCYDRLHQAVARARREQQQLAVLFIDLDNFKTVNDSLGHPHGDELLRETALRLVSCVRDTDTVARLGGDEYVVILPHVHGAFEVDVIIDKMLDVLKQPFVIDGRESAISASIGVTVFPEDGQTGDELLRKADTAMYAAKSAGRARSVAFREEMDLRVKQRFALQEELRHALERNEFSLVYQPEFDLMTGKPVCAEALLRWRHPERGVVASGSFIPILEEMGLIEEVGRWVLREALSDYARWREQGLQLPRISINVSGRQLNNRSFPRYVVDTVRGYGLSGRNVELELTEHSLVADFSDANEVLAELGANGVRVAIDDFGTGYSSLRYLQGLQFDVLKIDRAFVMGLPGEKSVAIVQAIVAVARALGKDLVAEGIETQQQLAELVELGCDIGQGYFFSLPLAGNEVVESTRDIDLESFVKPPMAQSS